MISSILTNFTAADAYCIVSSPTVNRRSTDSQIQRHYSLGTRLTRLAALFLMLLTLGVGQMWGKDIYYLNVNNWGGVKCHNWGVSGTEWCNAEANMSSTVMTKDNHTYYKITLKNAGNSSCKFYNHTCNTDDATGDLTISGNCYQGGIWINMLPITGGTIIYDNSSTNWVPTGSDKVQFFVGDGGYTSVYDMTKIDHTKLYYKDMSSYGGATYLRFAKANYESNGFNSDNVPTTSTDIYTGTYEFNSNSLYLFTTTNTETHPDITTKYIGSDGSLSELNFTITLKAKVKAFGSASYVIGASKGNLNATSYKFSEYKTCGTSTGASPVVASGSTSGDFNAGYTAETSLSVTSITPGYTFKGWYDSDGNKLSDNTEYTTYLPKKTTDVYAYFEEDSWSVAFSNDGNGTVTEPNSTPRTVGQITGIDINASAAFGYQFSTWSSSTGGSFGAAGTANTKFYPTAATTVTANFARRYAYIEANFQVYDATRSSRTSVGNVSWKDDSRAIEMAYDGTNRRYYLHTYSTPAQLAERLNNADAYFYIKTTSSSSSTFTDVVSYYADGSSNQSLSAVGSANKKAVTTSSSANSFKFTGSDNGYVILYFDGTHVWYELEYGVIYEGNGNTGGTVPTDAAYYSGGATVTVKADPDSWAKTGYTFGGWTTADGGSGTKYEAGGTFAVSQNTILYAKWTQTVTLDANNGDTDGSVDVIFHGTTTSSLSVAEREGYTVEAYYADAECTDSKKVLTDNGNLVNYTGYVESNKWVHSGATTLYTNWTAKNYTIPLVNMEATTAGTESVDVTFDASTNMTASDAITKPTKTHYDFAGYWTSENTGATLDHQLIGADGKWIKDVAGYTSHDGSGNPTWVHDYPISLYAKWTEHEYAITMAVSPSGAGTTSPASTATGKLVTESGDIIATPAAGYKFKEWQFSKTGEAYDVWCADGYSSTDATIHIKAQHNGTLTAVFEERYSLVGSLYDGSEGGMPGWEDYSKTFTVNSSSPVDLTRTCTLQAGKTYKVQVHDLATSTNLGRSGCDPVCVLEENASLVMENSNNDVFLYTSGAGEYIFKITAVDGSGHPTLTVLRPYPVNFGQKYQDIDGTLHAGTTGGTAAVTAGGDALTSGDYVTYNTSVTHTATPAGGYTFAGWWSSDAFEGDAFSNTNPMTYAVTSGDNTYAKFVETSTSVTLSNDGHGKVQISSTDKTSTTCGVTTTRELTAVPNDGYMFSSWTKTSGDDISISSTSTNPTTLRGQGAGATSGQTVTANFTYRWQLKAESEGWGSSVFTIENYDDVSGDAVGYVDISLAANTNYQFTMKDLLTDDIYKNGSDKVHYMTNGNSSDWAFATDKNYNCGITTAGKGTYRFTWNVTDKTMTVTYTASYQVNYGASVGGSVSVVDDDSNAVPNGGYVRSGGSVTYTATPNTGYTFVGWCGNDSYGDPFTTYNPWTNSSVAATSNAYAKFKSTNFVIYRSGDKDDDPRAALDDVESYGGGTITEAIEFRMKVRDLDMWYSLCLPFTVSAVKVWDEVDGPAYYDIVPYYRSSGTFYTGHYIIRTPEKTTDLSIAEFGKWNDPESPTGYKPSKDTPYIIQWHDSYFLGKYISFFGAADQTIPSFSAGSAPSSDNVVNVCVNNSMTTGSVAGAYMLESDYGNGAWLRLDNADESRPIPPFECYLLVNNPTRARYMAIRPGMTVADTLTGWDDVVNSETKTHIVVYSISGICVTQYNDCSINEAGQRLSESYGEGLYILRTDNESVKLMVGGK